MKQQKPEKTFYANSMNSLNIAVRAIGRLTPSKEKCYRIKVSLDTESRSDKQNRLSFLWYKHRADHLGNSSDYERRFSKAVYGMPILLTEDEEFLVFYHAALQQLNHEELIDSMRFVPITSRFSTKQFAHYLNEIDIDTSKQGLVLPQPEDCYMEALMIQENKAQ